jgi:hypothetical protein
MLCCHEVYYNKKAKVGIVELLETVISRQRHNKHVSAGFKYATIEGEMFSMRPFVANQLLTRFRSSELTSNNTGILGRDVFCVIRAEVI